MKLRIDFKISNAAIAAKIAESGGVLAFCREHGISYTSVVPLLRFEGSPWKMIGSQASRLVVLRRPAERLCAALGMTADEVFDPKLYPQPGTTRQRLRGAFVVDPREFLSFRDVPKEMLASAPDQDDDIFAGELKEQIALMLKQLSLRAETILRAYYGLDGDGPKSYEEVGIQFGVTRNRVHQIVAEAMRKLRHSPKSEIRRRTNQLRDAYYYDRPRPYEEEPK